MHFCHNRLLCFIDNFHKNSTSNPSEGQQFLALNGGPIFKFNEAVSFIVYCDDQKEIDYYWEKLTQGGDPKSHQCGWLKDKFGLSWQVVPSRLAEMISDTDSQKTDRLMKALMKMKKLDLEELERAYEGAVYSH